MDEVLAAKYWRLEEATGRALAPWLTTVLPRFYETADSPWFAPASWSPPAE